jgi:hypothetical protein
MDLQLFWGVVKRYKRVALGGTLLALALAVLSYGTPSFSHGKPTLVPRQPPTYQSQVQLLITQAGGASYYSTSAKAVQSAGYGYLAALSPVYAGIASGNTVQDAVRATKLPGKVTAQEGLDTQTGDYTPFVTLTATGPTPQDAAALGKVATASLQNYVSGMQASAGVESSARITLQVLANGLPPVVASGSKKTIPILVLIASLGALVALLFALENRDHATAVALGRVPSALRPAAMNGAPLSVDTPPLPSRAAFAPQAEPLTTQTPLPPEGRAFERRSAVDKLIRRS